MFSYRERSLKHEHSDIIYFYIFSKTKPRFQRFFSQQWHRRTIFGCPKNRLVNSSQKNLFQHFVEWKDCMNVNVLCGSIDACNESVYDLLFSVQHKRLYLKHISFHKLSTGSQITLDPIDFHCTEKPTEQQRCFKFLFHIISITSSIVNNDI